MMDKARSRFLLRENRFRIDKSSQKQKKYKNNNLLSYSKMRSFQRAEVKHMTNI